jgi:lipopolysaccharide/colanic/teichoic acid biosynthesis glycosyltransferase
LPGLSGLAQVRGFRGPTDSLSKIRTRIALDRLYVRRRSFWLDVKLLLLTPIRIFGPNAL